MLVLVLLWDLIGLINQLNHMLLLVLLWDLIG